MLPSSYQLVRGQFISEFLLGPSLKGALSRANTDLCTRGLVVVAGENIIHIAPREGGTCPLHHLLTTLPHHPLVGRTNRATAFRLGFLLQATCELNTSTLIVALGSTRCTVMNAPRLVATCVICWPVTRPFIVGLTTLWSSMALWQLSTCPQCFGFQATANNYIVLSTHPKVTLYFICLYA